MEIRVFRESDRESIQEITLQCFNEHSSIDHNHERLFGKTGGRDWEWRKRRSIDEDIDAQPDGILVAVHGDIIIGFVSVRFDQETGIGWIPNLAVSPDSQQGGVGRQLIQAAIVLMKSHGMELAKIETLDSNEIGKHFYPSCGFKEVAKQVHYAMRL